MVGVVLDMKENVSEGLLGASMQASEVVRYVQVQQDTTLALEKLVVQRRKAEYEMQRRLDKLDQEIPAHTD